MKKSYLPYFALFLTSTIWGTTWVVSKIGIRGIHPLYFSAIRQTLGGLCYLTFFTLTGKATWPTLKEWGYLILMALLLFVLSNGLTTWGIKYISSGLAAIIGAIFPLFVAIINWLIGDKDKPNWLANAGLILGFAGVAIIFYEHLADLGNAEFSFGIVLSFIAAISWAIGTVVTTRNTISLNRYYSLGWQMFIAGFILASVAAASGVTVPLQQIPTGTWLSLGYMVLFGSVITFGAFVYSLHHLPTAIASLYAYINPIVAVVLGHFVLGEKWSLFLLVGALITVMGVFVVNTAYKKAANGETFTLRGLLSGRSN